MRVVREVLFDESDRYVFGRVVPLVPLAFPSSAESRALRPAGPVVDERDPRLRVLRGLAEQHDPVPFGRLRLAVEVLERLGEVVRTQGDPDWWLGLVDGRPVGDSEVVFAQTMAAERRGQVVKVAAALGVARSAVVSVRPSDDPRWWWAVEDGEVEEHGLAGEGTDEDLGWALLVRLGLDA